jgi:hypothetical protein
MQHRDLMPEFGKPVGKALDIPTIRIGIVGRIKRCAEAKFKFFDHRAITANRIGAGIVLRDASMTVGAWVSQ